MGMVCMGVTHCSRCLTPLRDDLSCPHCEWENKMATGPVHVSPETIEELKQVREEMNKEEKPINAHVLEKTPIEMDDLFNKGYKQLNVTEKFARQIVNEELDKFKKELKVKDRIIEMLQEKWDEDDFVENMEGYYLIQYPFTGSQNIVKAKGFHDAINRCEGTNRNAPINVIKIDDSAVKDFKELLKEEK